MKYLVGWTKIIIIEWFVLSLFSGNTLATENQQVRIIDVIEVKNGGYLHRT